MQMLPRVELVIQQFEGRSLRERVLIFLVVLAALVMGWQILLMEPLEQEQLRQVKRLGELRSELARIEAQVVQLAATGTVDPDAEELRRLTSQRARLEQLDERIGGLVHGLVAPREMARVLEEVLTRQSDLVLARMESLPAVPLLDTGAGEAPHSGVFRHGLRLEFDGSYLATLRYLRALEALQRGFHWEGLEVVMDAYPQAKVSVTVYTLSLSEGWIGV